MKRKHTGFAIATLLSFASAMAAPAITPYADNNGAKPSQSEYTGPLFKLNHAYPASVPAPAMPWREAIKGLITPQNAGVYAEELKKAVSGDMKALLLDYAHWDAAKRGWYNEPWLGSANFLNPQRKFYGREAIHGMYIGNEFDASLFAASGLKKPITTYVVTYYDKVAAQTLHRIWSKSATDPSITRDSTQFAEGAIIVKAAVVTADADVWPVMAGAQAWPIYITQNATAGNSAKPKLTNASLMQLDIIVKDSKSAPDTGWVFTTLVYNKDAKPGANGIWDQMVVLGAQWGNDPLANSTVNPAAPLQQNWNNPAAPAYGRATLGWGDRLSGPNDGAMNNIAYTENGAIKKVNNAQDSSCMSCHSTAQWNVKTRTMPSFLLPAAAAPKGFKDDQYLYSPAPGSVEWLKWFQSRKGNVPMDEGSIAADFDMVLTFKSLPLMISATSNKPHALMGLDLRGKPLAPAAGK